jgi:hypothetical protein
LFTKQVKRERSNKHVVKRNESKATLVKIKPKSFFKSITCTVTTNRINATKNCDGAKACFGAQFFLTEVEKIGRRFFTGEFFVFSSKVLFICVCVD